MHPEINFECVLPVESHARLIMNWRNDPHTLAMSFHTKPKRWDTFYPEFLNDYFVFPDLPPLFALYEGKRAAFLRFKPVKSPEGSSRRCCEISINVAPECRGKGIGQQILSAIQPWVAQQGYHDLYAEVKEENAISIKAFLHAGYTQLTPAIKILPISQEKIPIERFIAALTPKKSGRKQVFIIAEAGSNWKVGTAAEDLKSAQNLIKAASEAGADAVKFQVFRPETVYVPNAGTSDYLSEAGIKEDIRSIFAELAMPYEMIPSLASFCKQCGVEFMASAFSKSDFEAIESYVSTHKIASYEITHLRLLELAARTKKPLILSTGAAVEEEIAWALEVIKINGGGPVTLLQCTAKYPASETAMHLRTIPWLKQRFKCPVGLSDHSRDPLYAPIAAVALGAEVIEKHFTLDRQLKGPDHYYALDPGELEAMVTAIRQTEKLLGSEVKIVDETEQELLIYAQRAVQATRAIKKGEVLQENINIDILRPGKQLKGVHPKYLADMEGKPAKRGIALGSGLQHGDW